MSTDADNKQEGKEMTKVYSKVWARKGHKYLNNNGTTYECTGTRFNERGEHVATMKSPAGWVCDVHGLALLDNGTFEWDYSTNGHFE